MFLPDISPRANIRQELRVRSCGVATADRSDGRGSDIRVTLCIATLRPAQRCLLQRLDPDPHPFSHFIAIQIMFATADNADGARIIVANIRVIRAIRGSRFFLIAEAQSFLFAISAPSPQNQNTFGKPSCAKSITAYGSTFAIPRSLFWLNCTSSGTLPVYGST